MTIPTTYTNLQTAVEADLARSDLTAELPNFINRGEAILNRRLRLLIMETSVNSTLSASAETMSLPTGFLEHINLRFSSDNWPLTQVAWDDLDALKTTATGRPSIYSIGASVEFDHAADQEYTLKHRYFRRWDLASDETNTLLTNEPDIYLHASLVGSIPRTGMHPRAQGWIDMLEEGITQLKRVDGRTRRQRIQRVDAALVQTRQFDINRGY
jgi:hypothetical protein